MWYRADEMTPSFPCTSEPRFTANSVEVCRSVSFQNKTVGYVALRAATGQLSERLWQAGTVAMLVVLVTTCFFVLLAIRLIRWLFNPLQQLETVATMVAREGHYNLRAAKHSNDEVGRLIDCFNHMMEQVEERDESLLKHGEQMEAEVRLRTSELLVAKDRAEAAARVKSEFLANMSHEIRTPMTGVIGATELLLECSLSQDQHDLVSVINTSARSLLVLINDILDFSKIEAGKMTLNSVPFSLEDVCARALSAVTLAAHSKGLELLADIAGNVPAKVIGDPDRLQQLLLNLLGNAVKFTPAGEVQLSVEVVERIGNEASIRLKVRDTGVGIPAGKQKLIFESFTQADGSTSRQFGGTGLGLAISSRLAGLMGGKLEVESEPGRGSSFFLTARFEVANQTEEQTPAFAGQRALIVSTQPAIAANLLAIARQIGLEPQLADGPEAVTATLEKARESNQPIQLAVIDQGLDDAFETDVATAFREGGFQGGTVLLSAAHQRLRTERAIPEPASTRTCCKPVLPASLRALALAVMDHPSPVENGESPGAPKRPANNGAGTSLDILLAEDNRVNQFVVARRLRSFGHRVEIADNGLLALEAMQCRHFDAVLMDIQMPHMDGLEATRRQRRRELGSGRHAWIIGLTAHALPSDGQRCADAGMDDYMTKPVDFPELERRLQTVCRRSTNPSAGSLSEIAPTHARLC
jgi:signal transduction histidine kinase/CheY-like chemotaxis protein